MNANESNGKYVFDHIKIGYKLSQGNKCNLYGAPFPNTARHCMSCSQNALADLP